MPDAAIPKADLTARDHPAKFKPGTGNYGTRRSVDWDRLPDAEAAKLIVRLWKKRDRRLFGPERPGD